ncbi:MAG: tRNA (guanosine(37)-N1)-methyltransferase TrmD [Firmicutes bacterium]|nr:tRNA (guanosine(37)-N1)-methyltransferase TrmD [Bacillota bacterium]
MRIDVLTLFPGMFAGPFEESIIKRAQEKNLIDVNIVNIRDFAHDKHQVTDDYPFGGGVGMVMKPEPIFEAVDYLLREKVREQAPAGTQLPGNPTGEAPLPEPHYRDEPQANMGWGSGKRRIILLCPQGEVFRQKKAMELSRAEHLILICGHYEGVDERVRGLATDELSIGDYVLTGGELAAMVVVDAVVRLIPGVLGKEESARSDSFARGLLEGPQYTRPREYRGLAVPDVLLSGNHEAIWRWRRKEALRRTRKWRPDLLAAADLSAEDISVLRELLIEEEETGETSPV